MTTAQYIQKDNNSVFFVSDTHGLQLGGIFDAVSFASSRRNENRLNYLDLDILASRYYENTRGYLWELQPFNSLAMCMEHMVNDQCRALTRSGNRCSNKAKTAGFCRRHRPVPKIKSLTDKLKQATEIATSVGAIAGLIEQLIHVWQSKPFGPGPKMSSDYEYLKDKVGPIYPEMAVLYTPFTADVDSVDWALARHIYDEAYAMLDSSDSQPNAKISLAELESSAILLIDTMQPGVRELLLRKLGRVD